MPERFTERAIAYLKAVVPEESASVELSRKESPVLRPLSDDLCVAYVVDEGSGYQYVQNRTDRIYIRGDGAWSPTTA